jgi:glutamate synthase (NADPH/NADH) large chain
MTVILPAVQAAIEAGQEAEAEIKINNTNRV